MNKCSVGHIIFCWFVGIEESGGRYRLRVEIGSGVGNKVGSKMSKEDISLLDIGIKECDYEEIMEGVEKAFSYYCMEFNEGEMNRSSMINKIDFVHKDQNFKRSDVYAKKMSCVGVELMHKDDMNEVINKNVMNNKDINDLGDHFLVIKLMERGFLKRFIRGEYNKSENKQLNKTLLTKNSVRLAISIFQLNEINNYFKK